MTEQEERTSCVIPIWQKYTLSVQEAAEYFGFSDKKIRKIVDEHEHLWFSKGFVEYTIPNFVPSTQKIDKLMVSAELGSETPGFNNVWPSDISFFINDVYVGFWTSPGDFGDVKGLFNPDWWYSYWNQYGLLKVLTINQEGSFIDGLRISNITLSDLSLESGAPIRLKFSVKEDAANVGGLTIYGKNFGNYNQDIDVQISYTDK